MIDMKRITIPRGFRAAGVKAGIKPSGGLDLALLAADGPCAAAGTFTTNRVCAAPALVPRAAAQGRHPRNRGQCRQCQRGHGREGQRNAARTAAAAGSLLGCLPEQVLVASTGVIGHQLPMDRLEEGLTRAHTQLSRRAGELRNRRGRHSDNGHSQEADLRFTRLPAISRTRCWEWPKGRR